MARRNLQNVVVPTGHGYDQFLSLDGKGLMKLVKEVIAGYREAYTRVAVAAVLTFRHAAKHGDPDPLNELYKGLLPNDRAALRNYIRRVAIVTGLGLPNGVIPERYEKTVLAAAAGNSKDVGGSFLRFSGTKEQFSVTRNDVDPRVAKNKATAVKLSEEQLLVPDPDTNGWTHFNVKSNVESYVEMFDVDALKQVFRVASKFLREDQTDGAVRVKLQSKTKKLLQKVADDVGGLLDSHNIAHAGTKPDRGTMAPEDRAMQ